MTDKELSKLKRSELLEMLLEQMKENERLQSELQMAEEQLQKREFAVKNAGTLAEAALQVCGFFEAADQAARLYAENLYNFSEKAKMDYDRKIAEAETKAKAILRQAEKEAQQIIQNAENESKFKISLADKCCRQMSEKQNAKKQ